MRIFTEKFIPFATAIHLFETHSLFIYLLYIMIYCNDNVPSVGTVGSYGKLINEH